MYTIDTVHSKNYMNVKVWLKRLEAIAINDVTEVSAFVL